MHTTFNRSESSQVGHSEGGQVSSTVSADFAHCHWCSPRLSWWKATPLTEALFNLNLPNKWTCLNLP